MPKSHQLNKWRMIVDLSSPQDHSVNDGISPSVCSLVYASMQEAVELVCQLGRDTQLVKLDLKDAYRLVPMHPHNFQLLGVTWAGQTYLDRALPFGLRSAPKIFNAIADALAWGLFCNGVPHQLHYLDDFLLLGAPNTGQGSTVLHTALSTFDQLGVPVASHKTEGPATAVTFLGVILDSHRFELRLPSDKLARLRELLNTWLFRRVATRRELESLLGHLSHAATVIRAGCPFLRQLFSLLPAAPKPYHHVRLNLGARADLAWWDCFTQGWNGMSFFPLASPTHFITSDASGSFGCGAFSTAFGWFQVEWPAQWRDIEITAKEMVPIVVAAAVWGCHWRQLCICFYCDNMAVVDLLKKRSSPHPLLMHLLRCFFFYSAFFSFDFVVEHVEGASNTAADAISRNNLSLFASLFPQVNRIQVPQVVIDLLVVQRPNWGSSSWTSLFSRTLTGAFPMLPAPRMSQGGDVS